VSEVNDAPVVIVPIPDIQMMEDSGVIQRDLNIHFYDYDNDVLSFSVDFAANEMNVWITDDILYFQPVADWFGLSSITVTAQDQYNEVTDSFNVDVIPVNDAPFVVLPIEDYNVNEDFDTFTLDLSLNFADIEDDLTYSVEYDAEVIQASISDEILSISSLQDLFGDTEISVTASDGNRDIVSDEFWVYIQAVNDPPVMALPDSIEFFEDIEYELDFASYIVDVDSETLTLTSEGNTNIYVDINGLIVTFSNMINWNGSEMILFHVADEEYSISDQVIVTVIPQAEELTLNLPTQFTFNEDEQLIVNFEPFISNPDGVNLELSYNNADNVSVNINALMVTFSGEPDWNGSDMIDFTVFNTDGLESSSDNVEVVIIPVNDPPAVAPIPDLFIQEDSGVNSLNLNEYFADIDGDILQYSVIFENDEFTAEIDYPYLNLEPLNNWNGTSTISVTAQDVYNRYAISDTFDVVVSPVNDAPYISILLEDIAINEDEISAPVDLNDHFDDIDNEVLTYSAITSDPAGFVEIDGSIMSINALENWNGGFTVSITADDLVNRLTVIDTFNVIVLPVNDPPYIVTPLADLEFVEDFEPYTYDLSQNYDDIECEELFYNAEYNAEHIGIFLDSLIRHYQHQ